MGNGRLAVMALALAALGCTTSVASAQDTSMLTPPKGWQRVAVDAAHAHIAPHTRTVGKWVPPKAPAGDTTAIYFAVGDTGGDTPAEYVQVVIAALPAGVAPSINNATMVCGSTPGWRLGFTVPASNAQPAQTIEETIATKDIVVAIARYERPASMPDSTDAIASLLALCPQSLTP